MDRFVSLPVHCVSIKPTQNRAYVADRRRAPSTSTIPGGVAPQSMKRTKATVMVYPFIVNGEYLEWHRRSLLFLAPNQGDIRERTEKGVKRTRKRRNSMTDEQKDLGTQGREASREGKRTQGNGWLRKVVGKVTGNREMQAKGAVQETGGKLQTQGERLNRTSIKRSNKARQMPTRARTGAGV